MRVEADIAVIGVGPVGLFAVFEAGMLGMNCAVIDTLAFTGGQCAALYPEKPIYDIPAIPSIQAEDLIKSLEAQAAPFKPRYLLGERVEKLEQREDQSFFLTTSSGAVVQAKVVVIAAGCGAFGPNRPPLEKIEEFEEKSVFYHIRKKDMFAGKRIAIAGGGDSAADWAIALSESAAKVYFVHRRAKLRCAPESEAKLQVLAAAGRVEMVIPYQLKALRGQGGVLDAVMVENMEGQEKLLVADFLLPFFGLAMELGPITEWGLSLDKNHISVNPATMETSIPGIYGIGDIITYPGKLKLILCGFAEGAMAMHHAYKLVHPERPLHFEYSTTKGVRAA